MHHLQRIVAVAAWTTALLLFAAGLGGRGDPLDAYALGCFSALIAMTFTGVIVVEHVVQAAFVSEAQRSRQLLAGAVATALADELEARGHTDGDGDGDGHEPVRHIHPRR